MAFLSKLIWRFCRNMIVGIPHTGFAFLLNTDCGNPAIWREGQHDARGMPGFIARQEREQAIQPDPRESLRRDAGQHFFPDSGAYQFASGRLLFAARETDVLGPLGNRIADPGLHLPAQLQSRQVERSGQQQTGMDPAADAGQPAVIGERGPQELSLIHI